LKKLLRKLKSKGFIAILIIFMFSFAGVPLPARAAITKPSAPSSVKASPSSYSSISVSWGAVTGAAGYEVYRATSSSGTYSLMTRTTARTYNNTALTVGKTYYYKVRAYKTSGTTRIYGNYSYVVSSKTVMPSPVSVQAQAISYNSINISWAPSAGVSGYELYRALSSTGAYSLITRTSATSYNNTGLTAGKTYYYKVRSYKTSGTTRIYGSYSPVASSKPVPTVPGSLKTAAFSSSSINVSWSGVSGASGYELHRANTATGTYSLVTAAVSTSYTNTGLSTSTTYYYKVRAYTTVSGIKVYGNFSQPISGVTLGISVTGVSLNKTITSLPVGGTDVLAAAIAPANATNKAIKWTSSNSKVAVVDDAGKVTAVGGGTATITAVTVDGAKTASCTVTVIVPVAGVSINKPSTSLILGNTETLTAAVIPSDATNQTVKWTSSDNTIAAVDNKGTVTPLKPGIVTITATTEEGNKAVSCTVTVSNANIKGIDVSRWQGTINWNLVKADGIQFAVLRSSYGDGTSRFVNNGTDITYESNYAGAKANGIAVGAYHYSYATTVEQAVQEANFFISKLRGKQFEYPIVIDIEDSSQSILGKQTVTDIALVYLNMIKQAGYYPMVYTSKYFFTSILDDTRLTGYDHWVAQYYTTLTYPGQTAMWQYTSSGTVNGISGTVDMNTSYVDYATKIKALKLNGF
jgi:uncharacterized protein YjdB